jgi:uncharacterized membrane protein YjjB (DUF3815 family)
VNTSNLIVLAVLFSIALLLLQRTERRRWWVTALVLIVPVGWLVYRWAIFRGQVSETLAALGIAVGFNALFWLVYGRTHPPRSSDEITVIGMEDE